MQAAATDDRSYRIQRQANMPYSTDAPVLQSEADRQGRSNSRPPVSANGKNIANFPELAPISPEARRRQIATHRRSDSLGSVRDGVGNLNRWSQSTTSSKGSTAHVRSNSSSRALGSASGTSKIDTFSKGSRYGAPKSESSPQRLPLRGRDGSNLPPTLPPIITLPTYRPGSNDRDQSPQTGTTISPSTAGLLSAAVRSAAPDYFGDSWEHLNTLGSTRNHSMNRSPIIPSSSLPPGYTKSSASPVQKPRQGGDRSRSRGHSRNRSHATKGSSGTISSEKNKDRSSRQPSQKAMLSKALQKANTAVVLDNAMNFEGAMQAYSEACDLLQQVMMRSSGDEDRRKLEAIRNTYTSRITELVKLAPYNEDDKALPARPESIEYTDDLSPPIDDDGATVGMATMTTIVNQDTFALEPFPAEQPPIQHPRRRDSLVPQTFDRSAPARSPIGQGLLGSQTALPPPMERQSMMVPPLSPRPPTSPMDMLPTEEDHSKPYRPSTESNENSHAREISTDSISWLDTIDESGGSGASSVHSRTSSLGMRRKHIRAASGATEAEFDAALDAAVEAAYDDGFEPVENLPPMRSTAEYDNGVASMRMRVEMARERVRQTERETAVHMARDRERERMAQDQTGQEDYYDGESEEEERMLEEMTRGYVMDEFEFGLQSKSALPRESDSSGFSGRTWHSSLGSNPTTSGTTMSTITETTPIPKLPVFQSKTPPPVYPPPGQAPPLPPTSSAPQFSRPLQMQAPEPATNSHAVRGRRLSGQNPKQLKIDTTTITTPKAPPPEVPLEPAGGFSLPKMEMPPPPIPQSASNTGFWARQTSSPFLADVASPPTPTLTQSFNLDDNACSIPCSGSPGRAQSRSGIRKNFSSSSLKNLKSRNPSVSHVDDGPEVSPNTPMTAQFGTISATRGDPNRLPAMPALPTPIAVAFRDKINGAPNGAPTGGLYLFDNDMHSPESPSLPKSGHTGGPIPLEPCPTEHLLRPFWLMRAFYQTLVHTRGGYLSTKLFVPRDVWRVKGVKIKGLEEKISCCDLLTAALQKLAQVDTFDADAVLDEMQAFEDVLEQARAILVRKLGNDVGVQGSGMLFKDASSTSTEAEATTTTSKTSSGTGKQSSFSWRRLRSKSSGVALNNYGGRTAVTETPKEGHTISSLPMTTSGSTRFAKRDISQVHFTGPNANYMSALAKLFDAAQVLDQIARQVEDPGLKHADKTQVGLELSTRHAAEFFGFYICRFVVTDIGMLLDKFLKRGSEWVLI
ncbi:hypothetical protein VC83_06230 [Pseudogymnoascus destructans]|uniref:MIT domain-containing protein n=2 Tax=Pseudogymnoascus destructans TaxID=655981 RepID=L8GCC0_PSED2|nr:uncharacterized protein VC83_06230 [Pseudogymnoascus destructans]ELR09681.1 hypothetical protein GMDG_04167 [Pseudogymnoascus destructans 20631-21]OAF58975.1 hypothetical protein VC83_06230 [Pseudogymnoascus destructans]